MKELLKWYKEGNKPLHRKYAYKILLDIKTWFMAQPTLVDVAIPDDSKFTVCGDIHGQFYDLLNIFELNGLPSETNPYVSFISIYLIYKNLVFYYDKNIIILTLYNSYLMVILLIEVLFQLNVYLHYLDLNYYFQIISSCLEASVLYLLNL